MEKTSAYLLQKVDKNCNDCKHLERMFGAEAAAATDAGGKVRAFYGHCTKKQERTMFMPATCMPDNEHCFTHRKD